MSRTTWLTLRETRPDALTMEEIITDLDFLGKTFQKLFGIVGGVDSTDEFERLFVTRPEDETSTTT